MLHGRDPNRRYQKRAREPLVNRADGSVSLMSLYADRIEQRPIGVVLEAVHRGGGLGQLGL